VASGHILGRTLPGMGLRAGRLRAGRLRHTEGVDPLGGTVQIVGGHQPLVGQLRQIAALERLAHLRGPVSPSVCNG